MNPIDKVAKIVVGVAITLAGVGAAASASSTGAPISSHSHSAWLSAGDHSESLVVGGVTRSFIVHVPSGRVAKNRPLILVYPGATDTATDTIGKTDFEKVANRVGDIVVFMQGYSNTWNDLAGHTPAEAAHINDIGFTNAVLSALIPLTAYNSSRVALTGLSNGALMVQTLGCRVAARIRLIVPVEGEIGTGVSRGCSPSRPISVYEIHGTSDSSIPFGGGTFSGIGGPVSVLSASATVSMWAHLDGCAPKATASVSQNISLTQYSHCRNRVSVSLRAIVGGVHVWGNNIGELVTNALGH